ncbi:MAG: VacJ family lipoprotein [Alphaproteobacteria bacterium]|nr:VacJ family lipoprotein [Alphaproteobacteria bacterium]
MKKIILCLSLLLCLTGCATVPTDPEALAEYERTNDPLEPMNRGIFKFNLGVERYVLRPVVLGYRAVTTQNMRENISTFLDNLQMPVTIFNDLIQGRFQQLGKDSSRFVINTLLGFFGFFDVANKMGITPHKNSFATTLSTWGMDTGPYLMLPLLGPIDGRGALGYLVDYASNPETYLASMTGSKSLDYLSLSSSTFKPISTYEQLMDVLDDAYKSSADYYAFMRSAYRQGIAKKIRAESGEEETINHFNFEMEDDE